MRKLLIPLLAALTLPTFAGDLGDADYKYNPSWDKDKEKRSKLLRSEGTYAVRCGHFTIKKNKICKIEFKDGKLIVDDSKGISPDQIISFSFPSVYFFQFFYEDSDGIINFANFEWKGIEIYIALRKEFLIFMNQGKDLPDNYF
tara:strand:- start:131 stop:562 length:432 start_codon:yes stop_codon:yes gene_type:complete